MLEACRWLECVIWSWSHIEFVAAIAMKLAIAVAIYRMASFIYDEADRDKWLMIPYLIACSCIQKLYYKRAFQALSYKSHWRGDQIQESNPLCVLSCCFIVYLSDYVMMPNQWFKDIKGMYVNPAFIPKSFKMNLVWREFLYSTYATCYFAKSA